MIAINLIWILERISHAKIYQDEISLEYFMEFTTLSGGFNYSSNKSLTRLFIEVKSLLEQE
jgi:hypothetical protein